QENDRLGRNTSPGSSKGRSHSILAWTCIARRGRKERLQRNSFGGFLHRSDFSGVSTLSGRSNSTGHFINRGRSETYSRRRSHHVGGVGQPGDDRLADLAAHGGDRRAALVAAQCYRRWRHVPPLVSIEPGT